MASTHNPNQNHLLDAMTPAESDRLAPHLELVPMKLGEVYYDFGNSMTQVYFPTTAILSLCSFTESGASAEVAGLGNEGMLGISLLTGGDTTPCRAFVRKAGYGYKLKAQILLEEFNRGGSLQHVLLRYNRALFSQTSQTLACRSLHSVEQQLCRWLLLTLDRHPLHEQTLTHEQAASMLGIRREVLTEATNKLQQAGFIRNRRGHFTVLNRCGLEGHACECYPLVRTELDRISGRAGQKSPTLRAEAGINFRHDNCTL